MFDIREAVFCALRFGAVMGIVLVFALAVIFTVAWIQMS